MQEYEFIDELIEIIANDKVFKNNFNQDSSELNKALNNEFDELVLTLSQVFFRENFKLFSDLISKNYLKAIISLPVYSDEDNLIILIFDSGKTSDEFILIDESDSLIHKETNDWTYIKEELIKKIYDSYNNFENSQNSIILEISDFIDNNVEVEVTEDSRLSESDMESQGKKSKYDELLTLKKEEEPNLTRKKRIISNEIADELLSLKEKQSTRDEISRHNIKSFENNQINDFPMFNELLYFKKRQDPENLLYKNEKPLIDEEVPFRKLGKIADLHNITEKNDKDSILIATCKGCGNKLVFYNHDIPDFKGEVFIELDNIDDKISKDYLYEYLNSANGIDELLYFSKGNSYIAPKLIKNVKIPIPSLKTQKEIVKVSRESREFFKTVDLLKKEFDSNILDYKHMKNSISQLKGNIEFDSQTNEITSMSRSWRHAYMGLIWPLAISYLSATKGGFETVEKKDNYLVLFEFIAAFNSIILISGLPKDVYNKNFNNIWDRNLKEYKQMTFGNWFYLCKNLAEVYKNNNFTTPLDEELFEMISSEKILNILEEVKNLRNDESHGPQTNSYEASEVLEKLDVYLDDVFDILEIYSNYKLIYSTGDVKASRKAFNHRVISLNGPCSQPIYDTMAFDDMLYGDSLYLYNPKNNKKLLIEDNLLKFKPVETNKKRWALFVYYSCDRNEFNAFYRCFQSKENDYKESISSFKKDILYKSQ